LVHYNTDGLDLAEALANDALELDPSRLTVKEVRFTSAAYFDIKKSMQLVNDFLSTFVEFYEGDDVDANLLPAAVKTQFEDIAVVLQEIKDRENKVDEFKKRLYDFMVEKDIKSIKNDMFAITRVDPTESKSFDGKKYMDDMAKEHPRKAKKILAKYYPEWASQRYADFHDGYTFASTCPGSVGPAIICFLESTDYVDCLKLAISLGGDADTLAAISGPMAYAYYKTMPEDLVAKAKRMLPKWMLEVNDRFDRACQSR
jgi:hypothetical protein